MLLPIENKLVDNNQCASLICLIKTLSTAISVSSIIFIGVSCLLRWEDTKWRYVKSYRPWRYGIACVFSFRSQRDNTFYEPESQYVIFGTPVFTLFITWNWEFINLKITSWNSGPRQRAKHINGFSEAEKA